MESINGTVFLYCALKDEKNISFYDRVVPVPII